MSVLSVRIKLLSLVFMLTAGVVSPAFSLTSLTILADNNMGIAVAEIAREYSRTHQVVVNTSFAPPDDQESEIIEGGSADVLITPRVQWMEHLRSKGLLDVRSQTALAKDQLVLVGPTEGVFPVKLAHAFPTAELIKRMEGEALFVVGNPQTQASGISGKQALRNLGVAGDMEPYTLYIKGQDQMVEMVMKQHAYGVFLYSATIDREGMKVLDVFPKNSYKTAIYYASVIAGDNMDEARKFIEYLKSPDAKELLTKNGFSTDMPKD